MKIYMLNSGLHLSLPNQLPENRPIKQGSSRFLHGKSDPRAKTYHHSLNHPVLRLAVKETNS